MHCEKKNKLIIHYNKTYQLTILFYASPAICEQIII